MVTDSPLLLRKLASLQQHRRELREYEGISAESYTADWKVQRIVERTLQMMIETCADIAAHIVAEEGLRIGQSVADTFRALGDARIVPPELVPRLVAMAGFRNLVVHQYDDVDPTVVVGVLRRHLGDFERFGAAIQRFLAGPAPSEP